MNAVNPTYAVISCGTNNQYGHPHAEVMNRLREMGIKVFRTDEQGTIIVKSDGSSLQWNSSPSASWISGEPAGGSEGYVLNTNTKVYHLPTCPSVYQMSEKNSKAVDMSSSEIEAMGYRPCGNCLKGAA